MRELLNIKGFLPFLLVLTFNAMVDIAHKITIQNILIKSYSGDTLIVLSALVNALILVPFILLFSPSGWISDRFDKSKVVRYMAFIGLILSIGATVAYYNGWFIVAFGMTLLLATQSAIYSPAKYGLIKEIAGSNRLGEANAVVQALTILSILVSGLIFSMIFESIYRGSTPNEITQSIAPIGWLLIIMSIGEFISSTKIPASLSSISESFDIKDYLTLKYLKTNLSKIRKDRNIWLSILGLSIFWGLSQLVVAAFPAHFKAITGSDDTVMIQAILTLSGVGIIIGSIIAGRFSRGHIELGLVTIGAFGIFLSMSILASSNQILYMALASLLFGVFGGMAIVPLNSTIQFLSPQKELGTILAGNNFIQNIVMLLSLVLAIVLVNIGVTTIGIFHNAGLITLLSALYALRIMPQLSARLLLLPIFRSRYRFVVEGLENLPAKGGVLLLGNHISWIDWLVLQIASPRAIKFVMERHIYEQWYLKIFLKRFGVIPISSSASKSAIKEIRDRLKAGEVVALFPEGRISYNGQLNEFKRGFETIMSECEDIPIVPFYLHGLWGSTFSRANPRYRLISKNGSRRDIGVYFGTPLPGSANAFIVKQSVRELSFKAWSSMIDSLEPLHIQWLRRSKESPFARAIADSTGADLNRVKLLSAVLLFVNTLKPQLKDERFVGVLLPTSAIGAIINLALLGIGKIPVNLNYTLSSESMRSAVDKARIKTVISSEKFLSKLSKKGFNPADELGESLTTVEESAKDIDNRAKLKSLLKALLLPKSVIEYLYFEKASLDDTATVLFSSGSEGTPKGIELTHRNLLGNIKQTSAMLNFTDDDLILDSLPIFHSFGLTITTLLPLTEGIPVAMVPDPTDAFSVGKMSARYQATIIFGTSTFFRLYTKNRKLHPLMFESIRMGVAGAEKLKDDIKSSFKQKFGVKLYEGYGATETSPVISVNMPDILDPDTLKPVIGTKPGTVGQPLPGTIIRICDPDTLEELPVGEDGLILVAGVQVMKGYLNDRAKTDEVIAVIDGVRYYKTGDKGHIDEDGFITIVDRYSRFAKIGGEMISLGAVEEKIYNLLNDDIEIVAISVPDEKKGERIVLLFSGDISIDEISSIIKASDIPAIMQPSKFKRVEGIPKLASGKVDYKGSKRKAIIY